MGPLLVANGAISAISGVITLLLAGNRPTFIIGMIDYKESSTNLSEWIPKWLLFSLPVSLMPATTAGPQGDQVPSQHGFHSKKHRPRSPCGILGSNWKSNSIYHWMIQKTKLFCYDCLPLLVARRTKKHVLLGIFQIAQLHLTPQTVFEHIRMFVFHIDILICFRNNITTDLCPTDPHTFSFEKKQISNKLKDKLKMKVNIP